MSQKIEERKLSETEKLLIIIEVYPILFLIAIK